MTTLPSDAATTGLLTPVPGPSAGGSAAATSSVASHQRARTSVLANVSLVVAVVGAIATATGVLAAPGAVLGLVAALFGMGGITATRQQHITGTGNAVVGVAVGLLSLVAGALAVTGILPWLDPETNQVTRLVEWLDANLPWVTPVF